MAALAVRHNRNVRPGRYRVRHESGEDVVHLDYSKEPLENVTEILRHVLQQHSMAKGKKLAYLNCFVHLIRKQGKEKGLGLRPREILCCLRVMLFDEAKEVRSATLRVIRHLFDVCDILDGILYLHIDYLIARSLDLCIDNEMERMHALKLIRKICNLHPHRCPASLLFPLVAVCNSGASERDRLWRACLVTICELAMVNPEAVSRCRGISSILRNVLDCYMYPRINESLVLTIMYLLNHPRTRHYIRPQVDLEQLLAPFTDRHFKFNADNKNENESPLMEREDRERRLNASKMALITIMRSWPGLIRMCHPEGPGLQSLVGILYLPFPEIRQSLIEALFDLFRLPLPAWTADFTDALLSIDPGGMKEEWKLNEGFVADEGKFILPHMAKTRPNLVENHLALILSAWIHAGILEALSEVVISTEGHLNVRANILLGELLHLVNTILPSECSTHSHCLPNLMSMAASFQEPVNRREAASVAVTRLVHIHTLKKRGPVPSSLFLDQLLQHAGRLRHYNACHWQLRRDKLCEQYAKKHILPEDLVSQAVKDTQVLVTKDHAAWNWDAIGVILKWPDDKFRRLEDQNYVRFVRRLVDFFKPTNHLFSHLEISFANGRKYAEVGCHLITFLIYTASIVHNEEANRQVVDLLTDIANCLFEVASKQAAPEAVFGLNSLYNTLSQFYFVFIGHFSSNSHGNRMLEKNGVYQNLLELVGKETHEIYTKLAIACLNYTQPGCARVVLSKALTACTESGRVYATKFLRVVMRSGLKEFSVWGVELLVTQLYDPCLSVAMAALNVLDEACDVEANLQALVKVRPALQHHGVKGRMAFARLLSTVAGFRQFFVESGIISSELEAWRTSLNMKYVAVVDEMLCEALTTYEKTYQGSFTRRSIQKRPKKDVYLPHHLYGQLTLHEEGFQLLKKEECIVSYFHAIQAQQVQTDSELLALKTALWAVGNVGMSVNGVVWLQEEEIIPEIIRIAEECGVYSIRGTAFYVLGLLASTRKGTEVLAGFGWESRCCNHHDRWPIVHEQAYTASFASDAISLSDVSLGSGIKEELDGRLPVNHQLSFILEEGKTGSPDLSCACDKSPGDSRSVISDTAVGGTLKGSAMADSRGRPVTLPNIPKSRTLPLESGEFRRYQSMPLRHPADLVSSQLTAQRSRAFSDETQPSVSEKPVAKPVAKAIPVITEPSPENSPAGDDEEEDDKFPATFSPTPVRGSALNGDSSPDVCEQGSLKQGFIFKIGNTSSSALREERSYSSESSNKSKSRTSSFNTDSTTSGVSSCDSGAMHTLAQPSSLSPIPSTTTINSVGLVTPEPRSRLGSGGSEPRDLIHPSSTLRRLARLSRVPSIRRRSAGPNYGSYQTSNVETLSTFTTYRDALGYATLRNIKRQRTYSSDENSDMGIGNLFGEPSLSRTVSIDSTCSMESSVAHFGSLRRNISGSSLPDFDTAGSNHQSPAGPRLRLPIPRNHFRGLAIPVDVLLIFEDPEDDSRFRSDGKKVSSDVFNSDKIYDMKQGQPGPRERRSSQELCLEHVASACLACTCLQLSPAKSQQQDLLDDIPPIDADEEELDKANTQGIKGGRPRVESVNEASSATPGSITGTSTNSSDSAPKGLSEDNAEGRSLIRKEIYRQMVNLGSFVCVKIIEQTLLNLKQRFPAAFQDLCFYSEACRLLASYSYRLSARRFIQELFDELDASKLMEEPRNLLNIEEEDPHKMAPIRQSSQDSFSET